MDGCLSVTTRTNAYADSGRPVFMPKQNVLQPAVQPAPFTAGVGFSDLVDVNNILISVGSAILGALFRKRIELFGKRLLLQAAEHIPKLKTLQYTAAVRTELLTRAAEIELKYAQIITRLKAPITTPRTFSAAEVQQIKPPQGLNVMVIHPDKAKCGDVISALDNLQYPYEIFPSIHAAKAALLRESGEFSHIFCSQSDTTASRGVDFFKGLPEVWRKRYHVLAEGEREYFGMYPEEVLSLVKARLDPYDITFLKSHNGLYERMVQELSDSFGAWRVTAQNVGDRIYSAI